MPIPLHNAHLALRIYMRRDLKGLGEAPIPKHAVRGQGLKNCRQNSSLSQYAVTNLSALCLRKQLRYQISTAISVQPG